jgi:hypothetical protein
MATAILRTYPAAEFCPISTWHVFSADRCHESQVGRSHRKRMHLAPDRPDASEQRERRKRDRPIVSKAEPRSAEKLASAMGSVRILASPASLRPWNRHADRRRSRRASTDH